MPEAQKPQTAPPPPPPATEKELQRSAPPSSFPDLSAEEAAKQQAAYIEKTTPKLPPAPEAAEAKGEPGASPEKPLSDDGEAAAKFMLGDPADRPQSRRMWDRQAATNQPVIHEY
jgi:hypothetical protein